MDNKPSAAPTPVTPVEPQVSNINYSPMPPQTPPANQIKKGMGKSVILIVVFVVLIILAVSTIVYFYFLKTPKTYNAAVYIPPKTTVTAPSPSPTPTGTDINKNDSSDNALNSDSSIIDSDVNSASSDLDGVSQSFNDQQTNLQ